MNVAFECWIPVVTVSGERRLASLYSVLAEGEQYADLAVRPHQRVALMRLFICVAHAALDGPKDYDEWLEIPNRLPESAHAYLTKWRDSFDLFHETRPWLQVAKLKPMQAENKGKSGDKDSWSPLSKLCFSRASGHNSTLFDHESNGGELTIFSPSEIALNLITFQNFFVAGGKASSRMWGNYEMNTPPNPKGGPCSGKSILFTFIRGGDLAKTLHININTFEDLRLIFGDFDDWLGRPIWEVPIKAPNDNTSISNATETHLGRLVPQTRILLVGNDCRRMLLGAGFLYPKFQDKKNTFLPDPFATVVLDGNGERALLSAKPNVSIWRQLHSIFVHRRGNAGTARGSICLYNLQDSEACDIIVNALITNPDQTAEILDLVDSVFHIPSQFYLSEGIASYETEIEKAGLLANRLGWAIETYRNEIDPGWESRVNNAGRSKQKLKDRLHSLATIHYWTAAEKNLPLLMSHIEAIGTKAAIPTREAWRKILFKSACDVYHVTCGQETPRQMKAFTKGWQRLTGKSKHHENKEEALV